MSTLGRPSQNIYEKMVWISLKLYLLRQHASRPTLIFTLGSAFHSSSVSTMNTWSQGWQPRAFHACLHTMEMTVARSGFSFQLLSWLVICVPLCSL